MGVPIAMGVIGAGRMGRNHCRVFSTLRHARLAGVCDLNPTLGDAVAREFDAPFFGDLDDLLDHVGAVSVATPTPAHFEIAMQCLAKGVHAFVEKPVAETLAQAEVLARTAEASGLVVQVGHIERFNPTYTELRHVLENLTPVAVNFRRLSPYFGSNTDVDVILDLMIHDLDLVLDLTGEEPLAITACGLSGPSGAIDHAVASLHCDSGPLVTVTASRLTEEKVRLIEVTALEAYAKADLLNKSISVHHSTIGEYLNQNHRGVKYRQLSVVEHIVVPIAEPLHLELQHFVDCVKQRKAPLVSARHGLEALRLATRIREAVRQNLLDVRTIQGSRPAVPSEQHKVLAAA